MHPAALLAAGLAIVFFVRGIPAAPRFPITLEEEIGITEALEDPALGMLLGSKLRAELNVSPLHYLWDKAWLSSTSGWLSHTVPEIYFRLLPMLWFAAYLCVMVILCFRLSGALAISLPLRLLAAGTMGLLLQTNGEMIYCVAFQDRPYALWFFLLALQMLLLDRELAMGNGRPSASLAALGALLSFTTVAAAPQMLAAFLVRWFALPKAKRKLSLSLELVPSLLVGGYYFLFRHDHYQIIDRNFLDLWGAGLTSASLHRSDPASGLGMDWGGYIKPGPFAVIWFLACLLLPLLSAKPQLRRWYFYCIGLLLAALPTTLVAKFVAGFFEYRYLYILYPVGATLQLLALLALAERLGRKRYLAGGLISLWAIGQLVYRSPNLASDFRASSNALTRLPVVSNAHPDCPRHLRGLRSAETELLDMKLLKERCRGGRELAQ